MKIRLSLLALACALFIAPVQAQPAGKDVETELGEKMDKMGAAFRALRRQAADPSKNADSLAKVAAMKEQAQASIKLEPAKTADLPAGERAAFVANYRAEMKKFVTMIDSLEAAFKANKNEEAAKILGTMADAQKAGHKDFQKKKKKA
jgi:soluble cytochrome b562